MSKTYQRYYADSWGSWKELAFNNSIGTLSSLTTNDKTSTVNAINEINSAKAAKSELNFVIKTPSSGAGLIKYIRIYNHGTYGYLMEVTFRDDTIQNFRLTSL